MQPHMISGTSMAIASAAILIKLLEEYGLKNYRDIFEQCRNKHSDCIVLVQNVQRKYR